MTTTTVSSGQTVSGGTITSGNTEVVLSGGTVDATTVSGGGLLVVSSGGHINNVSAVGLNSGAGGVISIGGVASDVQLTNGSELSITGGLAIGVTLTGTRFTSSGTFGSTELVNSGGTASATIVGGSGYLQVSTAGVAVAATVDAGGSALIQAGGTASGTVVNGGDVTIDADAVASGTVVRSGTEYVSGQDDAARVSGGVLQIVSGGVASGTVILDSGSEWVGSGAVAEDISVSSGGSYIASFPTSAASVSASGMTLGATVFAGGFLEISYEGSIDDLTISSGGVADLEFGGIASGVTVLSGGAVIVSPSTQISGLIVSNGGIEAVAVISSGETLSNTGATSRFLQTVNFGGTAVGVTVLNGGNEFVSGTVSSVVVSSGGVLGLAARSTASGITVLSGGTIVLDGTDHISGLTVKSGGIEVIAVVLSGQTFSGVTVYQSYDQLVDSGGTTVDAHVMSYARQDVQGLAIGTVVDDSIDGTYSGGQFVLSGGQASGTIVDSGGLQFISSGGVAVSATVNGSQTVEGVASDTIVNGEQGVVDGGLVIGTTLRGIQNIYNGGNRLPGPPIISGTTIERGGLQRVFGSEAEVAFTTIEGGGRQVVSAANAGSDTVIESGGIQQINEGGAGSTLIERGGLQIVNAGLVSATVILGVQSVTNSFDDGSVSYAVGDTISSGGRAYIGRNSIATSAIVSQGGILIQTAGGNISGAEILSGGRVIYDAAAYHSATVDSGGIEVVGANGKVSGLVVSTGVTLNVSSGGTVNSSTIDGGTEAVYLGAILSGITGFGTHSTLAVAAKNGEHLVVSGFKATDAINLTNFKFSVAEKLSFVENAKKTGGLLTITDGALKATVTLFGQYMATGFHLSAHGAGTAITYSGAYHSGAELAASHT